MLEGHETLTMRLATHRESENVQIECGIGRGRVRKCAGWEKWVEEHGQSDMPHAWAHQGRWHCTVERWINNIFISFKPCNNITQHFYVFNPKIFSLLHTSKQHPTRCQLNVHFFSQPQPRAKCVWLHHSSPFSLIKYDNMHHRRNGYCQNMIPQICCIKFVILHQMIQYLRKQSNSHTFVIQTLTRSSSNKIKQEK